jgi:CubicO group peptidase (beta-lactamase class C family)
VTEIRGHVADGFEEVRDVFEQNFDHHGEVGAGFCVYLDGEEVVNITGGVADATGRPYDEDTLQLIFSSTKGATAVCANLLVERGEIDLDAPVSDYWPGFERHGKADVPVSWLLCHRSGLITTDARLTFEEALDWDTVIDALADSRPRWEPGTQHGYHAVTYGWLVGEIVRRVSGRSLGRFFAEEVAAPLGLEFWIGLPEEQADRVSPLIPMSEALGVAASDDGSSDLDLEGLLAQFLGPDNLIGPALSAPGGAFGPEWVWNDPRMWAAEVPAANGITNARGLARMYAGLVGEVGGTRLLSKETIDQAIVPRVEGPDAVLMLPIPFGLGFMLNSDPLPIIGGRSFGHFGAGGSVGLADPDRHLATGYVMNKMLFGLNGDARSQALLSTVDRIVG